MHWPSVRIAACLYYVNSTKNQSYASLLSIIRPMWTSLRRQLCSGSLHTTETSQTPLSYTYFHQHHHSASWWPGYDSDEMLWDYTYTHHW